MLVLDPVIDLTARAALGGLFVSAGIHKAVDARAFEAVLAGYRLVPDRALPVIARTLPLAEIGTGLALWPVDPSLAGLGLAVALVLLLAYATAIGVNLLRGHRRIDCGCLGFGRAQARLRGSMVARNLLLAAIAAGLLVTDTAYRPLGWVDWVSVAAALLTAALLYLAVDLAIALPRTGDER